MRQLVNRCDYIDSVGGEGVVAGTPKDTQGHCPETLYGGESTGDTQQRMSIDAKTQRQAGTVPRTRRIYHVQGGHSCAARDTISLYQVVEGPFSLLVSNMGTMVRIQGGPQV